MNPVNPDMKHPARNASVRNVPDCANDNAVVWSGFNTRVDVTKTMIASGMRITAIVLN